MNRIACCKCNVPVGWKAIVEWLNSVSDPLICGSCSRTIASEVELLGFYFLVGALGALGITYLDEISRLLLGFGLGIPGLILALGISVLSLCLMVAAVVLVLFLRS